MERSRHVWRGVGTFVEEWACLEKSGQVWRGVGRFGEEWHVWRGVGRFGEEWACLERNKQDYYKAADLLLTTTSLHPVTTNVGPVAPDHP